MITNLFPSGLKVNNSNCLEDETQLSSVRESFCSFLQKLQKNKAKTIHGGVRLPAFCTEELLWGYNIDIHCIMQLLWCKNIYKNNLIKKYYKSLFHFKDQIIDLWRSDSVKGRLKSCVLRFLVLVFLCYISYHEIVALPHTDSWDVVLYSATLHRMTRPSLFFVRHVGY